MSETGYADPPAPDRHAHGREIFREQEAAIQEQPSSGPSAINGQVTDALAATIAAEVAGMQATGALPHVGAQAAALAMLNAVNAQQNAQIAANAALLATVNRILAPRAP